jgi:hypothetical protein
MIWSDPIVDEVRCVREEYAARFNYDLRAIFRDLKEQEKCSGRKLVSYAQAATGREPNWVVQSPGAASEASENAPPQQARPAPGH